MKNFIFCTMLAMTLGAFCGCSAIRYNLGYRAGMKEYKKAKKVGGFKRSYGTGYLHGMNLLVTFDELDASSKKLTDAVKELENIGKRQNERMKELGVTDEDIDKALKDAFDDMGKTKQAE